MKQIVKRSLFVTLFLIISGAAVTIAVWQYGDSDFDQKESIEKEFGEFGEFGEAGEGEAYSKIQANIDRSRYFFRMLKDPATNSIPPNIRKRELNFARRLPDRNQFPLQFKRKDGTVQALEFNWEAAGPVDVGGRTRALSIDQRNSNTIIAGGTSGGIWKSTDGGTTWDLKTDPTQHMSVTSVAQDPTSPDTWYYTSGEYVGNTASARGGSAPYFGTGVYKSTDNGDTWTKIPETNDTDADFNSPYDFITRVVVSPTTGSVFIASNGIGIYRSTDSQPFPEDTGPGVPAPNLGTPGGHLFCDVAVGSDGRLVAALSSADAGVSSGNPGVFVSYDDGDTWEEITSDIAGFPNEYQRSVIAIAPSAPDTVYIMTYVNGTDSNEDVQLHFVDLNNHQNGGQILSEDRTSNIPDFGGDVGYMSTQSNYNMEVAVKPDDPEFVLIGGINLFRSRDGFDTRPSGGYRDSDKDEYWIGGYDNANDISQYPQQHPDQHVVKFDPGNPDIAWAGHDGGLSKSTDITAAPVSWTDMNNGYVTTQFYASAIPEAPGDDRLMGGTQDNGTPYFRYSSQQSQQTQNAQNIFTGDGGYAFFTPSFLFVSAQRGIVLRWEATSSGDPRPGPGSFSYVHPSKAHNQFFIQPYAIDPNDQNIMYYPDGDSLWRNTQVTEISTTDSDGSSQGWNVATQINASNGVNYQITALEVSRNPSDVLYYAAYANTGSNNLQPPRFFKLTNASTSSNPREISIPGAADGSFPHDITTNPSNGNELLAVFSNYNVPSVFRSTDGGETWQNVEGNLSGSRGPDVAEPSVRSATIIQGDTGTIYLLGTSTGIYSTTTMDGSNTQWVQEAPNSLGFTVTEYLASRSTDGTVAAGTHGRGIFKGNFEGTVSNNRSLALNTAQARPGQEVTITGINFTFSSTPEENEVLFDDEPAEVVSASPSELTVTVPRISSRIKNGTPVESNNLVQVKVTVGNQTVVYPSTFEILPPEQFTLHPNYPNPFNLSTTIPVDLPQESGVIIQVFDMSGRKVLEPISRVYPANNYNFEIDMGGLASGVYIYRVVAIPQDESGNSMIKTRKMTLIK